MHKIVPGEGKYAVPGHGLTAVLFSYFPDNSCLNLGVTSG